MARDVRALFLDFDGVICDSLEECFQSSWLTDHAPQIGPELPPEGPRDEVYRTEFRHCRPFVRSGEDYVVLHRLIEAHSIPDTQAAFDEELARVGKAALAGIKTRLYRVREDLLKHQRARWLGWNPLYPGMGDALRAVGGNERVYILSTKKAEFIAEILAYHKVDFPAKRIIYSGKERKLDIVDKLSSGSSSLLIDDQVDHLDFSHPLCDCRVALWGYVTPGAIHTQTPALSLEEALKLISRFA